MPRIGLAAARRADLQAPPTPAVPTLTCARCRRPVRRATQPAPQGGGRVLVAVRHWPEGPLCSNCFSLACETYGQCEGCGAHRLVPGLTATGHRLCTDCGGGLGDYICTRCGREGWRQEIGICGRCVLTEHLSVLLDDGSGTIRAELQPFFNAVCAMGRPRSGILWLNKPHVPPNRIMPWPSVRAGAPGWA